MRVMLKLEIIVVVSSKEEKMRTEVAVEGVEKASTLMLEELGLRK